MRLFFLKNKFFTRKFCTSSQRIVEEGKVWCFMKCNYEIKGTSMIIFMPRELDHHCATQIRMEADMLLQSYPVRSLTFDFSETEFMDSSGIGVIIGRCKNMGYAGGEVRARNLNERVQKIFVVSGLHKIVSIDTNMEKKESIGHE